MLINNQANPIINPKASIQSFSYRRTEKKTTNQAPTLKSQHQERTSESASQPVSQLPIYKLIITMCITCVVWFCVSVVVWCWCVTPPGLLWRSVVMVVVG